MFQIQTCTCYVSLFEIKRIQAVVAVHKGLKDWDPLRVNGHLADQKFESRGKTVRKGSVRWSGEDNPSSKGNFPEEVPESADFR